MRTGRICKGKKVVIIGGLPGGLPGYRAPPTVHQIMRTPNPPIGYRPRMRRVADGCSHSSAGRA